MPRELPIIIISISLFIIVFFVLILIVVLDTINKSKVLKTSKKIQELIELNKLFLFYSMSKVMIYPYNCPSKKAFDTFRHNDFFLILLSDNRDSFNYLLQRIEHNRTEYEAYKVRYSSIRSYATEDLCTSIGLSLEKYLQYENDLFKKMLLPTPTLDVAFTLRISYTSPKGRNSYVKDYLYYYSNIKALIDLPAKVEVHKMHIMRERALMTDSLRYDILERDNYRCQICGATAADGIKLHIDHIIPVSKGGKTIYSNLRTLCDRCNLGKSDKL